MIYSYKDIYLHGQFSLITLDQPQKKSPILGIFLHFQGSNSAAQYRNQ